MSDGLPIGRQMIDWVISIRVFCPSGLPPARTSAG